MSPSLQPGQEMSSGVEISPMIELFRIVFERRRLGERSLCGILTLQYENKEIAGWYNVGPDESDCVTTGKLVDLFCKTWGNDIFWENQAEANAPHEANFLKLDCSKMKAIFGWRPQWHIDEAIRRTVEWSRVWLAGGDIPAEMDREIKEYMEGKK